MFGTSAITERQAVDEESPRLSPNFVTRIAQKGAHDRWANVVKTRVRRAVWSETVQFATRSIIPSRHGRGYSDRHGQPRSGHYPCAARALPLWGAGPGLVRVAQLCPVRCRSLRRAVVQIPASIVSLRRHGSVYGNIQSACVNVTRRVSVGAFAQRHGGNCGGYGRERRWLCIGAS
jgi:hypothetical protein